MLPLPLPLPLPSILLSFLLERMDSMGDSTERSNLYLKLFKLVFGSVTLFAQENELMLKVLISRGTIRGCGRV